MPAFTVEGYDLHYQDVGQGDVIVLGHEYFYDHSMWSEQVRELSRSYRCIVPDFWGHGLSSPMPDKMMNLQDYAKHVLALLDSLNIDRFSLVGLSLGGIWSVELTLLAPQRVKNLALLSTFVGLEPEVNCLRYNAMFDRTEQDKQFSPETLAQLKSLFFAADAVVAPKAYVAAFEDRLMGASESQIKQWLNVGKMMFRRPDRFDEIETFALPVLILAGADDRARPPLESYLMNDAISGSELHILTRTGHMSCLESSAEVTSYLQVFYARWLR